MMPAGIKILMMGRIILNIPGPYANNIHTGLRKTYGIGL
jgi:hypothetical protein